MDSIVEQAGSTIETLVRALGCEEAYELTANNDLVAFKIESIEAGGKGCLAMARESDRRFRDQAYIEEMKSLMEIRVASRRRRNIFRSNNIRQR